MKSILKLTTLFLLAGTIVYVSCQKELSCYDCIDNILPIANAGKDTAIILPVDSISLDGSSSTDPDGTITSYKWAKISGPVSSNINKPDSSKTLAKTLVMGVYKFELTVTDNGGLSAKDTMQVVVDNPAVNQPPFACAGADQIITLPANTVTLNGSCSTDPDNSITSYAWTKISGPSSFNIANTNVVQTQVTNLVQGTYQFELKVTDAGGLFSRDTMQVTVNTTPPDPCAANRPLVPAQLIPFTSFPPPHRNDLAATQAFAAGDKLLFVEDWLQGMQSRPIHIYSLTTQTWSNAELSNPRISTGIAVSGDKVYFGGGGFSDDNGNATIFSTIDIYNATTNSWSVSTLSSPRLCGEAVATGNKILFACGDTIEIYNTLTNTCSVSPLSVPRWGVTCAAAGNKAYFAGGYEDNSGLTLSNRVDVYDPSTDSWSQFSLMERRAGMAAIGIGNKIFWAGGRISIQFGGETSLVEITGGIPSSACLFQPNAGFHAVRKDNKIVFFTGMGIEKNKFDIYNMDTNSWSIGVLNQTVEGMAIVSHNNTIYVAGGAINGALSFQIYKLEF